MKFYLVALLVAFVYCALDDIIPILIENTDNNPQDGIISSEELSAQILSFDINGDGSVAKHEFTEGWIAKYNDNHPDTNSFFNNLDANTNHILDEADILLHIASGNLDPDSDSNITTTEFEAFIRLMHPGHGNHEP